MGEQRERGLVCRRDRLEPQPGRAGAGGDRLDQWLLNSRRASDSGRFLSDPRGVGDKRLAVLPEEPARLVRHQGRQMSCLHRRQVQERPELRRGPLQNDPEPPAAGRGFRSEACDGIGQLGHVRVAHLPCPRHDTRAHGLGAQHRAPDTQTEQCAPHSVSLRMTANLPATGTIVSVTRATSGVPRTPPVTVPTNCGVVKTAERTNSG